MISAVIFDMDGVIVDSEPLHTQIVLQVLADLGFPADTAAILPYIGVSNTQMWGELRLRHGIELPVGDIIALQQERTLMALRNKPDILSPGLLPLLAYLDGKHLLKAVASSSDRAVIETILQTYDLTEHFPLRLSGEDVQHSKPAPDIFLLAAEKLGVPPRNCLVIEDSRHGIQAALGAGMQVIAYRNPSSGYQDVTGAQYTVESLSEIHRLNVHL